MSETKQLAGIFPWPKTSLRCGVYSCNRPASYMLRHAQGLFGDTHFPLCEECAKDIARNLPEELRALVPIEKVMVMPPAGEVAFSHAHSPDQWPELPKALSTAEVIRFLMQSPDIQALAKGGEVDPEVRKALGSLIDILAEAGAEVETSTQEQISAVTDGTQSNRMPDSSLLPGGGTTEALTPKTGRKRPDFGNAPVSDVSKTEPTGLTCPICGKGPFKSEGSLRSHMNAVHRGGKKK